MARLHTTTQNELRAELKPAMNTARDDDIEDKVARATKIKIEELQAEMDKKLEVNLEAKTSLDKLTAIVKPKMEAKMQAQLKVALQGKLASTLSGDGLAQKLSAAIRKKYMEGTKKAAMAYVESHHRKDIEKYMEGTKK